LEPLPKHEIGKTMDVLDDVVNESNLLWQRSVVGFFLGYKMPYHAMKILAF
jgi:hypothetical protein